MAVTEQSETFLLTFAEEVGTGVQGVVPLSGLKRTEQAEAEEHSAVRR